MERVLSVAVVTGSGGLIGAEMARFLLKKGFTVIGIDNNLRRYFFGPEASTEWSVAELRKNAAYRHFDVDIRGFESVSTVFRDLAGSISLIVHTAAQPSHDWAAKEPFTDFAVNANGTLNLLEAARQFAPEAPFVHLSTNKVYGDTPNRLPLVELERRWEIDATHPYHTRGIDEGMSIDQTTHSLFGASKLAGDILVQEYGRYFGMRTVCLRGGCLTGGGHSGAELHGFLAYLMKCTVLGWPYTVFGYKAKQVRDNLHCADLAKAVWAFFESPTRGRVYNVGGGRPTSCSMLEAIDLCETIAQRPLSWTYTDENRIGDHIWWISDMSAFEKDYPSYRPTYDLRSTLDEISDIGKRRWFAEAS